MKRIKLLMVVLFSLSITVVMARSSETLEKEFQDTFSVKSDAGLMIENKYGNIYLTAWEKSEIQIDAIVKIESYSNHSKAKDLLEDIEIRMNGGSDYVKAVTDIPSFRNLGKLNLRIDYYVKLPVSIKLDIEQKYGSVILNDNWKGNTEFDISYGNLQARDLLSKYNNIDIAYGELNAENLLAADIHIAYSDLQIEDAEKLDVNTSYSDLEIGNVKELELKTGFDDIDIDGVVDLYARSSYTDLDIRKLEKSLDINIDYGSLEVDKVYAGFDKIEIDSNNAGVEIDMEDSASYTLEVLTRYGDFYMRNDDRIDRERLSHSSYRYTGKIGAQPTGEIIVDAGYASIEIK